MFNSILFPNNKSVTLNKDKPSSFKDLNLDQIFNGLIEDCKDFNLSGYFYTPLKNKEDIFYRQEIFSDFENKNIFKYFNDFSLEIFNICKKSEELKEEYSEEGELSLISQGHLLDLSERYFSAIEEIINQIKTENVKSQGLNNFIIYLNEYINSKDCKLLSSEIKKIRLSFSKLEYLILIKNGTVKVKKYKDEENLTEKAENVFKPFIEKETKDYSYKLSENPYSPDMENKILGLLSKIYENEFTELNNFAEKFIDFSDNTINNFSREIQFYIVWTDFINNFKNSGLQFCYPKALENHNNVFAKDFFDIVLGKKIGSETVTNSFYLKAPEEIIVITGPNQGGKTTFARAFGQLYYLFSLGLSVPGTEAALNIPENILTHFEKEEKFSTHKGKLQDELERLRALLEAANENSVIIINEIFSSTTKKDSEKLARLMVDNILSIGAVGVIVTFIEGLGKYNNRTVSMVSSLNGNSQNRSFKIVRGAGDCKASALYIAEKYNLTYEQIKRRLEK